jgi:hypothetical protein
MFGPFKCAARDGFLIDACHDELAPGDVVIADYRGRPDCRFEVLSDDGRGMFRFRDPDGVERPMRPSTMLNLAKRVERLSAVPAEWRDYAAVYGADEAFARAREAGGFGI